MNVAWCSNGGLARLLLASTALYAALATVYAGLATGHAPRPMACYYYAALALIVVLSLRTARRITFRARPSRDELNDGLIALGIAALAWLWIRYPMLLRYSVWFDEVTQFVGWDWRVEISRFAAQQQQPPLDYFLSRFAYLVYGAHEWAVVLHAAIFSTLSLGLAALWCRRAGLPNWLLPLPLVFLAGQHVLLQASSEGRPVGLAVFASWLWLMLVEENRTRERPDRGALVAVTLLLLYSLGMQPMYFVFFMSLCYAPRLFLPAALIPLLLYLPTVYHIYVVSLDWNQFHGGDFWPSLWARLSALNAASLRPFDSALRPAGFALLLAPLALLVIGRARDRRLAAGALAYFLAFPAAFLLSWQLINYVLFTRYFVLWPVGLVALSALCAARLVAILRARRPYGLVPVGAAVAALVFAQLAFAFLPWQRHFVEATRQSMLDWRELMRQAGDQRIAAFFEVPYLSLARWPNEHLASQVFETPRHWILNQTWQAENAPVAPHFFRIVEPLKRLERVTIEDAYFIFYHDERLSQARYEELRRHMGKLGLIYMPQERYFAVRVPLEGRSVADVVRLVYRHVAEIPPGDDEFKLYVLEALHHDALVDRHDEAEAARWGARLRALPAGPARDLAEEFLR